VASLGFAGDSGSLSDINATQGEFREQIAALNDLMRQVAGNAAISAGDSAQADPLNAPFTLYVNPYTGSDEFVGGAYNTFEAGATQQEIIDSKLKRLEKQRLTCGFTPQRPFRTINRAVIEAAIITSKDWYTITDPAAHVDCVSIVLAPGVHTLYNDPGSGSTSLTSWGTSKNPTTAELIQFNPATVGGVLLPRGCSLCGADLRKVTIRPNWVPANADEAADYSNRREMLKITGTGYFFGFTIMDKVGSTSSHHLLSGFGFASKAELDAFYAKTLSAVGDGADLAATLTKTRGTEYQIVGPIDRTQSPTEAWDTTSSASPYIFNCSIRSNYGMGGAFMDGGKVEGLKSMVTANFTGVSLQKDMTCWQRYSGSSWTTTTYAQYIATDPDNVRMKPERISRHISAINNAFIQEVSIFAIGQGIHHFTDLGGEVTITNSNSSFGGCAAISKGYKTFAFPLDRNWTVDAVRVPLNLSEKTGNIRRVYLGTIASITSSKITLETALAVDSTSETVPAVLLRDGYTLADGTRVWVENPLGDDWRTSLTASAWSAASADEINVSGALEQSGTDDAPGINPDTGLSVAVGKRVYVRRLVDTRTPEERRLSIKLNNTAVARLPQRNFIVQTDPGRAGGAIADLFGTTGDDVILVGATGIGDTTSTGVAKTSEITLRRGSADVSYAVSTFYRAGTVVKYQGKHYQSLKDQTTAGSGGPDPATWGETFVHMPSAYNAEDNTANNAPIILLDTDTSDDADSETLGINFTTGWTSAGTLRNQYRTATDYLGVYGFLVALGFSSAAAHSALVPQAEADRDRDPTSSADFPTPPSSGAASGLGNWAIEFRRPSVLRLYGHAWEWAGFLNYSKALPAAQQELGAQNKFTYYFTSDSGGRVVPQGSNEDGFNITPRGLEDIETGATLTVDAIGSATLDDFQVTDFPNGLTASTLEVDELIVRNTVDLPTAATTTEVAGAVELASAAELRDSASISGTNDTQRNNSINADPVVVTKKGLEYWKTQNRLVSARSGVQYVYVDPVNGRNVTSTDTLLADPPTSATDNKPVKTLRAAVNYANAAYSPSETVEFRIGPGVYLESETITFNSVTRIRAWNFSTQSYLNDDQAGGTTPFMGQASDGKSWDQTRAYFTDSQNHPIFLTQASMAYPFTPERAFLRLRPLTLSFREQASVAGVVWWGAVETITSDDVPDSFFAGRAAISDWRVDAKAAPDDAINYFIREELATSTSSDITANGLQYIEANPCISAQKALTISNVAIDAICPCDIISNSIQNHSVFQTAGEPILARGVWLIGNVNISSNLPSAPKLRGQTTYQITGFAESVFDIDQIENRQDGITLNLGGFREITGGTGTDADYNFTWNNIHLVNNAMAYPTAANDTSPEGSAWKNIGPAVQGLFGAPYFVATTNARHWHAGFVVSTDHYQGFAGKFGNYGIFNNASVNRRAKGIHTIVNGFTVRSCLTHYFLRQAGTTAAPADSGYPATPGDIGSQEDFDALNVEVTPIARGIDVDKPLAAFRSIKL
jgi:hypothetical protein